MDLADPSRLAAADATGLVDAPTTPAFDRAARIVAAVLDVPVAHSTIVLADRQFFPSQVGFPEPLATDRTSPLTHSFCKHVVTEERPFVVPDTRQVPVLADNPVVTMLGVAAYCGVPLYDQDGTLLGSLCGMQFEPRQWTDEEVALLEDVAAFLQDNLRLRAEVAAHREDAHRVTKIGLAANEIRRASGRIADLTGRMDQHATGVAELRELADDARLSAQVILDTMAD